MLRRHLKKSRVWISLLFLIAVTSVFIDIGRNIPESWVDGVLFLQFVPSAVKFVASASFYAVGFLLILLLTALLGRVYCSFICPLGVLQDIISYVSIRFSKKKPFTWRRPISWIRYGIVGVVIIFLLFSSVLALNLLDPYSIYGRTVTHLFKPAYILCNNALAFMLMKINNYAIYPSLYGRLNLASVIIALFFLLLIGLLSFKFGRLYCNTVCPVGTLLGLVARRSVLRIRIDPSSCSGCRRCEQVCKAECIDLNNQTVDMSRCISCFNCLPVCKPQSITYRIGVLGKIAEQQAPDTGRRAFFSRIVGSLGTVACVLVSNRVLAVIYHTGKNFTKSPSPVTPPGAVSLAHFNGRCTACHLCVSQCPTRVLQPSTLEYGLDGLMQPRMDYHSNFCNYECTVCGEVCPTGAIGKLTKVEKKTVQTGIAKFEKENCVVHIDGKACGACSEHCPTKAVNMIKYEYTGKNIPDPDLVIPDVKEDICIGCGACEYACPTRPYRAIYVQANDLHKTAELPQTKKVEEQVDYTEDFAF